MQCPSLRLVRTSGVQEVRALLAVVLLRPQRHRDRAHVSKLRAEASSQLNATQNALHCL